MFRPRRQPSLVLARVRGGLRACTLEARVRLAHRGACPVRRRLVLGPVGDINGVDIIAQPPGKRSQSLATLSGGERALAAAALLFALIEASPPPFCVLDEVDAALDEGNVGRFCAALQDLSDRTQFIIITHNRRTMESASTIYGLTLENRCESRILSLRLPEGPGTGEPKAGIRNAKRERAEPSSSISSQSPML